VTAAEKAKTSLGVLDDGQCWSLPCPALVHNEPAAERALERLLCPAGRPSETTRGHLTTVLRQDYRQSQERQMASCRVDPEGTETERD
jgi:hypothetical protein